MTKEKFVYVDDFPQLEEEAKRLFKKAYADDPFEDCDATLLNSADIEDYAKQVGLIFPFEKGPDGNNLKTASYGCLLYTSPSPRDLSTSRMPSSA